MSTLEATVSMLELLDEDELPIVQRFIKSIFDRNENDNPFKSLTDEQIYSMLATSRKQAENGEYDDADNFYDSMVTKYGV